MKFAMEVAKDSEERYPPRTVYGIVCGVKRHLGDKNGNKALNPLDAHDKRFGIFRHALDAEMKDATKEGLHSKCQKEEKDFVTVEEERKFWEMNLLGTSSAKSLLYTVYFYNGKIFGLRGGDHRNIVLNNFELGSNFIKFQENSCKIFHGGISDLKYIPRTVKHNYLSQRRRKTRVLSC